MRRELRQLLELRHHVVRGRDLEQPVGRRQRRARDGDTSLGTIVVDRQGMTVYYFDKDTANSGTSACSGQCLAFWSPVPTDSDNPGSTASPAPSAPSPGTTAPRTTAAGDAQRPALYVFNQDKAPGDVGGQGFMGIWWVVAPDGTKITSGGGASSSSASTPQTPSH